MNINYDLDLLRRRIERIEDELRLARQELQKLDLRQQTQDFEAAAFVPAGAGPTRREPAAAVPAAVTSQPPPLPSFLAKEMLSDHGPKGLMPVPMPTARGETPPPPPPAGPSELRTWLERLQLWPPSGKGDREARLGAWWATRIGMLLAVIGIVFFGLYVSRGTPPWVHFTELLAVSAGVVGLGLWLERKIEKFGAVVFAGGLALVYFCAFAGYAVQSVKIFDRVVVAAGWQLAAVALLAGAAVWRRSPFVATIGVALGYVTALFSHAEGLHEFALGAAWLLAAAAVVFHRWQRWEEPSVLALPATYAIYALVLTEDWQAGGAPARGWVWLLLVAAGAMFFARDWRSQRVKAAEVTAGERWFQGANSSGFALAGVVTALTLYRSHLAEFYFGAAALLALGAWLRWRQIEDDVIAAALTAKAAGAVTLGVIALADGRTVALALLVQAWVMLACATRMASRVLGWGTGVVALVACVFFTRDASGEAAAFSVAAGGEAVFVIGLTLLATEAARRLVPAKDVDARRLTEAAGAALAGALGVVATTHWQPETWVPTWAAALAFLLATAGVARRAWGPALAGALVLLVGNGLLGMAALRPAPGGAVLWWNALAALAPTVALGVVLGGRRFAEKAGVLAAQLAVAGVAAWALATGVVVLVFFNEWPGAWALGVATLLALGLAAAGPAQPERRLPWLATLAAAVGVLLWVSGGAGADPRGSLVLAAAGLWAVPVGMVAWPRHAKLMKREPGAVQLRVIQLALATVVTLRVGGVFFAGGGLVFFFALLALGVGSLVWWPGIAAALPVSWLFWLAVGVETFGFFQPVMPAAAPVLPTLAALLAWVPAWTLTHARELSAFSAREAAWRLVGIGVQVTLATVGAMLAGLACYHGAARLEFLVAALGVAALVLRVGGVAVARNGAGALAGVAWLAAGSFVLAGAAEGWGEGLAAVGLVAAALVAAPLALAGGPQPLDRRTRNGLAWVQGGAGLVLAFFALWSQRPAGELHAYVTVGWGVTAIAVFLTGLFARLRPHRLLGLAGLGLCVPRAFVVDLDSPLLRIVAFIVLGGVLLWVGFSYHRFRHLLVDRPEEMATSPEPGSENKANSGNGA